MGTPKQGPGRLGERRDVTPIELHSSTVSAIDPADDIQQGRFTRPTAPDDRNRRTLLDARVGMIEDAMNTTAFVKASAKLLED
jgi:hypothetical protein